MMLPGLPEGPSLDRVRGPVAIPAYETWQIIVLIAVALLAVALLIWGAVAWSRARRNRIATIDPASAALAELDAAAAHTVDDDERFTVLSSLAVRRYFENGAGIPSLGRTSEEFLRSLEAHPLLDPEARDSLARCLKVCDRVKFARQSLRAEERDMLTREAKALVQQVRQRKEPAES